MTGDVLAFMKRITDDPDDDLPRLVFADWLDEHGRGEYAEFIRLQIDRARRGEAAPSARERELFDRNEERWLQVIPDGFREGIEFRRGFVNDVTIPARFITGFNDAITELVPPPDHIRVTEAAEDVYFFFHPEAPVLERITDLSLPPQRDEEDDEESPVLLRRADATRIRTCSGWPRLRSLDLENCRLGDPGARELFRQPSFPALIDLDLSFNDLTDAGVIDLLNTGLPQRLERLVLGGNPIGDQAALELADRLGRSEVLESLNLRMTNIGQAGQAALFPALGGRVDLF